MLTEVKNNLKFLLISLKYNLKSSLEYKTSFFIQTIFMFINNGFFLIFWALVFDVNNGNVQDLNMRDILFIWSIAPASWGVSNFLFGGLRQINHYYGKDQALENINLTIEEGEFFTLLGPSGCGKTTILRILGGFITPSSGNIFVGDKAITNLGPEKRNM